MVFAPKDMHTDLSAIVNSDAKNSAVFWKNLLTRVAPMLS
jgi:hypothetical protein